MGRAAKRAGGGGGISASSSVEPRRAARVEAMGHPWWPVWQAGMVGGMKSTAAAMAATASTGGGGVVEKGVEVVGAGLREGGRGIGAGNGG